MLAKENYPVTERGVSSSVVYHAVTFYGQCSFIIDSSLMKQAKGGSNAYVRR